MVDLLGIELSSLRIYRTSYRHVIQLTWNSVIAAFLHTAVELNCPRSSALAGWVGGFLELPRCQRPFDAASREVSELVEVAPVVPLADTLLLGLWVEE